jgi:DNA invertase Pin-like site-specific DNA recombinase
MDCYSSAVILARVSSKSQEDEGYSLDAQVKLLENYCINKNLTIKATFKITESASKSAQRTIFKNALTFIEENDIKNLVIEKVDRHVRNLHDAVETHDWLLSDESKKAHFVKDSLVMHKHSRSQEWLNWGIRVVMAKNYIDNLREEAMKGWSEKLSQGWLPAPPPPGYKTIVENGKRIHIPDPQTYKQVQRLFKKYLEPTGSVRSITEEMSRVGIKTRSGNTYKKSNVHKMLSNPFYIGINRFDGKDYPGAQTPIISKHLYDAVQNKLHSGKPQKYQKHNPVLKGMIICGYCNGVITWQRQKGILYGSCQRKLPACKAQKLIKETVINQEILSMLDGLVSPSQAVVSWLTNLLKEDFKTTLNNRKDSKDAIDFRIEKIKKMDEMLYDDKLAGDITKEKYETKHSQFFEEIKELNNKKGGVDHSYQEKYMKGVTLIELSQVSKEQFADENLDNDSKRDILTKLFEKLVLKDNLVSVQYTKLAQAIAHKSSETRRIYERFQNA